VDLSKKKRKENEIDLFEGAITQVVEVSKEEADNYVYGKLIPIPETELVQEKSIHELRTWAKSCDINDLASCAICLASRSSPPKIEGFTEFYDVLDPPDVLLVLIEVGRARSENLDNYFSSLGKREERRRLQVESPDPSMIPPLPDPPPETDQDMASIWGQSTQEEIHVDKST